MGSCELTYLARQPMASLDEAVTVSGNADCSIKSSPQAL
jgi:hypothetical protein